MATFSFSRRERLSCRRSIGLVFKKGKRFSGEGVSLFVLPNGIGCNRFLCTFKRGFGSAVERNTVRRISKEIYRQNKYLLRTGFDIVFLMSSSFLKIESSFTTQKKNFIKMFNRAGLLKSF